MVADILLAWAAFIPAAALLLYAILRAATWADDPENHPLER